MYLLLLYITILVDTQWSGSLKITKGKKKKTYFIIILGGERERERERENDYLGKIANKHQFSNNIVS